MNLRSLEFPSNLKNEVKPIIDFRSHLQVNKNYTWEKLCGLRKPEYLTTIVVHHDGLSKAGYTNVSDVELASRIANGHINNKENHKNGDPGFPYDVWIRNGQAYWCNDILPLKYGVGSNNGYTVHVCVSGEYKFTDAMTDDDRRTLMAVILMLQEMTELPNLKIIKGHGEIRATHCPGIDMDQLRHDVTGFKHRITVNDSLEAKRLRAYQVANQTQFMYSMIGKDDGNESWALSYFERFHEQMRAEGWFKQ